MKEAALLVVIAALTAGGAAAAGLRETRARLTETPQIQDRDGRIAAPVSRGFEIDVMVNGRAAEKYHAGGRFYVEAIKGEEYSLRVRNPYGVRVAVALSVDGLNTIDARRTSAKNASKWVIEPYGAIEIAGWQMSSDRARRFYFTSESDSYAAKLGEPANIGVITAVLFRERRPYRILTQPGRDDEPSPARKERAEDRTSATESGGQRTPASPGYEYPGTGIGRSVGNNVYWVRMDLEDNPASTVTIRYEYRDTLVRLGIIPRPRPVTDPIYKRERATGFERGRYSPEPRP